MEDESVNIAQYVVQKKVLSGRPPSGTITRKSIIAGYAKELSLTSKNLACQWVKNPTDEKQHVRRHSAGENSRPNSARLRKNIHANRPYQAEKTIQMGTPDTEEVAVPVAATGAVTRTKPKLRRIQSAKARLNSDSKTKETHSQKVHSLRPASATTYKQAGQPELNLGCGDPLASGDLIEPSVYGYASKAYISGSAPRSQLDGGCHTGSSGQNKPSWFDTDKVLSECEILEEDDNDVRVPKSLCQLLPWQTPNVPREWIGVDPSHCLVFLPSLLTETADLPVIPQLQLPDQELPYKEPVIPEPVKKAKRYKHPWNKIPVEEWKCNHGPPPMRVYSRDGSLLHESCTGERTSVIVRKEITELENLMKGIGKPDGCSLIVRYQAEINNLQAMITQSLPRVEQIERREAEKRAAAASPDHFNMKAFYEEHDDIMEEIKEQHQICQRELATLEAELDLEVTNQHFNRQVSLNDDQ